MIMNIEICIIAENNNFADIDECSEMSHNCDNEMVAECTNIPGSFSCTCRVGFTGNGILGTCIGTCKDISILRKLHYSIYCMYTDVDECSEPVAHDCDPNAMCFNTFGSFDCSCYPGFVGNGISCCESFLSWMS